MGFNAAVVEAIRVDDAVVVVAAATTAGFLGGGAITEVLCL